MLSHRFCVAPMMDRTDRHHRMFMRRFSRRALLYTEMVSATALVHGDADHLLRHDPDESPLALQLGGSAPDELARAAVLGEKAGYDEINLNVGCPSNRVQSGSFGACLMAQPRLVAACVRAMQDAVGLPVTVKCRLGIDDQDSRRCLPEFVATVAEAGCRLFVVHARKAMLQGLNPRQNREIPPLDYQQVHALKRCFPELELVINGGITSMEEISDHLQHVDGVMLGRAVYRNPWLLQAVDSKLFGALPEHKSRIDCLLQYLPYVESELARGTPLRHMTRHLSGLFNGQRGARRFRRCLGEHGHAPDAGIEVLRLAMSRLA